MPSHLMNSDSEVDLRREIDALTVQAQGCVYAILQLLETDPQSPQTLNRLKARATDLQRITCLIQLKNHLSGPRHGSQTASAAKAALASPKRATAQPYCRPTRNLNEPR